MKIKEKDYEKEILSELFQVISKTCYAKFTVSSNGFEIYA